MDIDGFAGCASRSVTAGVKIRGRSWCLMCLSLSAQEGEGERSRLIELRDRFGPCYRNSRETLIVFAKKENVESLRPLLQIWLRYTEIPLIGPLTGP